VIWITAGRTFWTTLRTAALKSPGAVTRSTGTVVIGVGAVVGAAASGDSAAAALGDAPVVAALEFVWPQAEHSNSTHTANKSRRIVVSLMFLNP
jgi:hypothetical protein